jgi:hypothetical protein
MRHYLTRRTSCSFTRSGERGIGELTVWTIGLLIEAVLGGTLDWYGHLAGDKFGQQRATAVIMFLQHPNPTANLQLLPFNLRKSPIRLKKAR